MDGILPSRLDDASCVAQLLASKLRLEVAEEMYQWALAGSAKSLGPKNTSTLQTVNNLGAPYYTQGKLDAAEDMYQRTLAGYEQASLSETTPALKTYIISDCCIVIRGKYKRPRQSFSVYCRAEKRCLGLIILILQIANHLEELTLTEVAKQSDVRRTDSSQKTSGRKKERSLGKITNTEKVQKTPRLTVVVAVDNFDVHSPQ